jgi:dephospho-CoA kinase
MAKKIVIGLAGEMGSGKGTVAQYLVHAFGAVSFRYSDPIRDVLDRIRVVKSRENIASASLMLRETFGQDILSRIISGDVLASKHSIVLVDGIRRESDMSHLKNLPFFRLVYIEVGMEKRYERLRKRSENAGDSTKTFEQFKKEQDLETEQTILALRKGADRILENDGSLEDLYAATEKMIESLRAEIDGLVEERERTEESHLNAQ